MLREYAYAKINLALYVKSRRKDGFHNLETIFCTISLKDTLYFSRAEPGRISLSLRGTKLPNIPDNLVLRAARILQAETGARNGASITLIKNIPIQSGLGGGSADAAASLRGLCRLWNLRLPEKTLSRLALQLGSDVPFALRRGVYLGRGRGERLSPFPALTGYFLLFIPQKRVSTPWAFKNFRNYLTENERIVNLKRLFPQILKGNQDWERLFYNSFEALNRSEIPGIAAFAKAVEPFNPTGKVLSGSGSAYFAYFRNREEATAAWRILRRKFNPLLLVQPVSR
jgi:4-diphosphocytidyl-2-C-methyl-D-erythritol kinase